MLMTSEGGICKRKSYVSNLPAKEKIALIKMYPTGEMAHGGRGDLRVRGVEPRMCVASLNCGAANLRRRCKTLAEGAVMCKKTDHRRGNTCIFEARIPLEILAIYTNIDK